LQRGELMKTKQIPLLFGWTIEVQWKPGSYKLTRADLVELFEWAFVVGLTCIASGSSF
jgi:hypothetical protein